MEHKMKWIMLVIIGLVSTIAWADPNQSLTPSTTAGGTVTTPGLAGPYWYPKDSYADIVATADAHYGFVNWTGTARDNGKITDANDADTTVLMDANYTVQANFARTEQSLTISTTAGGTVTTPPGIGTYWYTKDYYADIVAAASENYHFVNWTGTAKNAGKILDANSADTDVLMDADYTVQANFVLWNPDDPNTNAQQGLVFRVTFDDNPDETTTVAVDYMYDSDGEEYDGTLSDYNTAGWDVWRAEGKIGGCADFNHRNDKQRIPNDPNWGGAPNDCRVWVDPDGSNSRVLAFGNDTEKRSWAFWFNDVDYNEPSTSHPQTSPGHVPYPTLRDSTIIRHQNNISPAQFWDMCIRNSKFQFRNFKEGARMGIETASDLNSLGVLPRFGGRTVQYFVCGPDDVKYTTEMSGYSSSDYKVYRRLRTDPNTYPCPTCTDTLLVKDVNYTIAPTAGGENYVKGVIVTTPTKLGVSYKVVIVREVDQDTLNKQWHHVVFVIDRTTSTSSKIYIDGLSVPVTYGAIPKGTDSGDINPNRTVGLPNPLSIGANGCPYLPTMLNTVPWSREGDFDGMLDDIRVYHWALSPTEVSVLYQTDYDINKPIALKPFPGSKEIPIATGLQWVPATNAGLTWQEVFFGKTSAPPMILKASGNQTLNTVANALLDAEKLWLDTEYQWQVKSTIGVVKNGPVWKFRTETGVPTNPTPANNAKKVTPGDVTLSWIAPNADSFDVYFSIDPNKVEVNDLNARIGNDILNQYIAAPASIEGGTYYWRVVGAYPHSLSAASPVWHFRTAALPIVFNTSSTSKNYTYCTDSAVSVDGYSYRIHGPGANNWGGNVLGVYDPCAGVIYPFPGGFDKDDTYDIIVIPDYTTGNDATDPPTPVIINVTGDFYFDGTMDISGDDSNPIDKNTSPAARCGGHRGPLKEPVPGVSSADIDTYYTKPMEFETRYGTHQGHNYYPPDNNSITKVGANPKGGYAVFGPGTGLTPPYKNSGGAGYGGMGGDSGRGYQHGIFAGGATYGDKEVPVPFGGSASSWAQTAPGNAGGGGVEIDANGSVTLGPHAQILAKGATTPYIPQYPAGGGSGGSVKIIAGDDVVIDGYINVDGGKGGDGNEKGNNTGGGGGGGRVAIFYGNQKDIAEGHISAKGGDRGVIRNSSSYPKDNNRGLSEAGQDGTIYIVQSTVANQLVRKASAPTPRNYISNSMVNDSNAYLVYAPIHGGTASNSTTSPTITTSALATGNGDMVIEAAASTNTGTYTMNNGFTKDIDLGVAGYDGEGGHKSATGADERPSVAQGGLCQSLIGFVVKAASTADPIDIIGTWDSGTTHAKQAGTNRALLFFVHAEPNSSVTPLNTVTYGGQTMTKVIDRAGVSGTMAPIFRAYVAAFILNEAGIAAASNTTFTPTWSGTVPDLVTYSSVFLKDVNQTTLISTLTSPTQLTLNWYSGYNVTDACDQVYCDTNPNPTTAVGVAVPAKRGQHSSTATKPVNPNTTYYMKVTTTNKPGGPAFTAVDSNVWTFKTVGWKCGAPDWPGGKYNPHGPLFDPTKDFRDPNKAGWPAWDKNRDCVVNELDFWEFAKNWYSDERGGGGQSGNDYRIDFSELCMYASEWMTCRARTNNGCLGWPLTPDWIPPGDAPL